MLLRLDDRQKLLGSPSRGERPRTLLAIGTSVPGLPASTRPRFANPAHHRAPGTEPVSKALGRPVDADKPTRSAPRSPPCLSWTVPRAVVLVIAAGSVQAAAHLHQVPSRPGRGPKSERLRQPPGGGRVESAGRVRDRCGTRTAPALVRPARQAADLDICWWRRWDSNPRPPACKAGALAN